MKIRGNTISTPIKPEKAVVKCQNLTDEEKAQARENIGALSDDVIIRSKNIFVGTWENAQYNNNGYAVVNTKVHAGVPPEIPVTGGEAYAFSWGDNAALSMATSGGYLYVHQFDAAGNRLSYKNTHVSKHSVTITMEANATRVGIHIYADFATNSWQDLVPEWIQIVAENASDKLRTDLLDMDAIYDSMMLNQVNGVVRSIAHRGDPIYAPQCTAPAYIVARKHGHTIMENDVMPTNDGHLVMWHDTTLSRLGNLVDLNGYQMYTDGTNYYWVNPSNNAVYTYGTDYVASSVSLSTLTRCAGANYGISPALVDTSTVTILPFDVLRRIDFGAWFDAKYKGTQILTFEEWIMLCKQLGCEAYVDHKFTYEQITDDIVTEMASIVKRCGMGDFTSWLGIGDIERINKLRETIPDARIGILKHPNATNIQTYASVNTGRGFFFNGDAKSGMTANAIQLGLNAGFDVEVWLVDYGTNTQDAIFAAMRVAVSRCVTGITLDHYRVDEAFKYLLEQY